MAHSFFSWLAAWKLLRNNSTNSAITDGLVLAIGFSGFLQWCATAYPPDIARLL